MLSTVVFVLDGFGVDERGWLGRSLRAGRGVCTDETNSSSDGTGVEGAPGGVESGVARDGSSAKEVVMSKPKLSLTKSAKSGTRVIELVVDDVVRV